MKLQERMIVDIVDNTEFFPGCGSGFCWFFNLNAPETLVETL
jgi:hypothetical protein